MSALALRRRLQAVLQWLEEQLNRRNTTAGCVFIAAVALPLALQLFLMSVTALWHPEVAPLFDPTLLRWTMLQAGGSVLIYTGALLYCWPRFRSTRPRDWLAHGLVTFLVVSSTSTAILYGHKDTPFGLMVMGSVALARTWFPTRILLPGLVLSLALFVGADVLIHRGAMPYAPLLTAPVATGEPLLPWWNFTMQAIYNGVVLPFSALMFFLFAIMQRRTRELENLTRVDTLTGLLNRATFMRLFEEECAKQKRTARPTCVMMCDVDHFKKVNDSYGHPAGDLVLVRLGHLLKSATRYPVDVPARFGGEEFVVLLPETDLAAAQVVAKRLGEQLRDQVFEIDGQRFSVTISIGVAETQCGEGGKALKLADDNLYAAKHAGRDRVVGSVAA
jgi:diguanylate cyclase (GGDEF)-like protein